MKHFIIFFLVLLSTGCNLFQGQQQVAEQMAIEQETGEGQPIKVFEPTEKELLETTDKANGEILDATTLGKFFTIEKVSQQEYQQALKHSYHFLSKDSLAIRKENGVIILPSENQTIRVMDTEQSEEEGDAVRHDYLGEIPALGQYVVRRTIYRNEGVLFIDKQTGKEVNMGVSPFLSPDNKHVIDICSDGIIMYLTLYRVKRETSFISEKIITVYPHYWILDYDKDESEFFSNDGYLYMPIVFHSNNTQRIYIKIGIKNQSSVNNK